MRIVKNIRKPMVAHRFLRFGEYPGAQKVFKNMLKYVNVFGATESPRDADLVAAKPPGIGILGSRASRTHPSLYKREPGTWF